MSFADRLKKARQDKGLSQSELAALVGIHYTQIGRYENKGAKPASDVLAKIADALAVSSDYLMSGSTDDLADSSISDKELLSMFKKVNGLSGDKKRLVKEFLGAFLFKNDVQQKLAQ